MTAYYNENNDAAADWLENAIVPPLAAQVVAALMDDARKSK